MQEFRALVLEQHDKQTTAGIRTLTVDDLPAGDVLVAVEYSALNYKDGLAVTGKGKIVRTFPMVPGIDFAGRVVESQHPNFAAGDWVILTGWGVGETHWGGYGEMARVKGDWLVHLPSGMTTHQAMAIGTAGFTAMLAVMALQDQGVPATEAREVAVTGAAGGVGSVAVALLARLGYRVVASTGRAETHAYLHGLGAAECIDRSVLAAESKRPLESSRWAGAVDTVGGTTLASLLRTMQLNGVVAACGLAGGAELNTTVMPFILRGVHLIGIDSVMCPQPRRQQAWQRLATELPPATLEQLTTTIALADVPAWSETILQGQVRGRVVVAMQPQQ